MNKTLETVLSKLKQLYNVTKALIIKHKTDIVMPTLIMVAISFTVVLALSVTNKLTAPKIEKLEEKNQKDSMHKVLKAEKYERNALYYGEEKVEFHIAKVNGKILGYIFITEESGYGGPVTVMTAITPDGKIKAAYVLNVDDETPGLGKQAAEKDFYSQFTGLRDKVSLVTGKPKKDKNEVKSLTGATITSKAVTRAVNKALTYSEKLLGNNNDKGGSSK